MGHSTSKRINVCPKFRKNTSIVYIIFIKILDIFVSSYTYMKCFKDFVKISAVTTMEIEAMEQIKMFYFVEGRTGKMSA